MLLKGFNIHSKVKAENVQIERRIKDLYYKTLYINILTGITIVN